MLVPGAMSMAMLRGAGVSVTTGQLWAWGANAAGQLGRGNTTGYSSPVQIGNLTTWSAISGYQFHSLAVKSDGTLWAWGDNGVGQLGLGNTTAYSSPKQVGALTTWSKVFASGTGPANSGATSKFSLAIKTDGTLWAWGQNAYGQLGLGNVTYYSSPKQVGALTTWLSIGGGTQHTLALKTDGTMWAWGRGTNGLLGLGNTTTYSSPKQIGALTTWTSLSGGSSVASFGIIGGKLYAWGYNLSYGQLGLGNTTSYSSPKQVGALTTWSSVKAGRNHTVARTTGGTVWTWGKGSLGRLGLGNTTAYSSPTQVGALTSWTAVSAGVFTSLFLKNDSTIWGSGYNATNAAGALGDGSATTRSSPVQVLGTSAWVGVVAQNYASFGRT